MKVNHPIRICVSNGYSRFNYIIVVYSISNVDQQQKERQLLLLFRDE
jgi:hypothetical protein